MPVVTSMDDFETQPNCPASSPMPWQLPCWECMVEDVGKKFWRFAQRAVKMKGPLISSKLNWEQGLTHWIPCSSLLCADFASGQCLDGGCAAQCSRMKSTAHDSLETTGDEHWACHGAKVCHHQQQGRRLNWRHSQGPRMSEDDGGDGGTLGLAVHCGEPGSCNACHRIDHWEPSEFPQAAGMASGSVWTGRFGPINK